ncbi:MAG: 4Fe-4S binding protein [Acidilobaceae archaeon]
MKSRDVLFELGAVVEGGTSARRKMADWRTFRPEIDQEKCVRCYICWVYCPDSAIIIADEPYTTSQGRTFNVTFKIDYDACKGCGICAEECPVKAITLLEEVR